MCIFLLWIFSSHFSFFHITIVSVPCVFVNFSFSFNFVLISFQWNYVSVNQFFSLNIFICFYAIFDQCLDPFRLIWISFFLLSRAKMNAINIVSVISSLLLLPNPNNDYCTINYFTSFFFVVICIHYSLPGLHIVVMFTEFLFSSSSNLNNFPLPNLKLQLKLLNVQISDAKQNHFIILVVLNRIHSLFRPKMGHLAAGPIEFISPYICPVNHAFLCGRIKRSCSASSSFLPIWLSTS